MDHSDSHRLTAAARLCRVLDCLAAALAQPAAVPCATDWPDLGRELASVHAVLAGEGRVRRSRPRSRPPASGQGEDAHGGLFPVR